MPDPDDHDGGFAHDLPGLLNRRKLVAGLGLVGLLTHGFGARAEAAGCLREPDETSGPYPGDGTNAKSGQTVNALRQSGVLRGDMRASFNGMTGTAAGATLRLDMTLVSVAKSCAPVAGQAVYLWHANAIGQYSLYDLPDQNYLRGVVVTDAVGRATITTIVPGCYAGRWPHIHFEVFAGLASAVSGRKSLLTSQFALPGAVVADLYDADPRYPDSLVNFAQISLAQDNVFGDNTAEQIARQTPRMTGDAANGYTASVTIGLA